MIHKLTIYNGFYDEYVKTVDFSEGLNVIAGRNGKGKSHMLECINFALFGSTALRGPVGSYNSAFAVRLELTLGGVAYKIDRSITGATISSYEDDSWVEQAKGITAVNTYVKRLLTYCYDVYKLTNFSSQTGLLQLSAITPTSLVSLVETISGVNTAEGLLEYLKDSSRTLQSNLNLLRASQSSYESDIKSLGLDIKEESGEPPASSEGLRRRLEGVKSDLKVVNDLRKRAKIVFDKYLSDKAQVASWGSMSEEELEALPDLLTTVRDFELKLKMYKAEYARITPPGVEYEEDYLNRQEALIKAKVEYDAVTKALAKLKSKAIVCPSCGHEFTPDGKAIDNTPQLDPPEAPEMSSEAIQRARVWLCTRERYHELRGLLRALEGDLSKHPSSKEIEKVLKAKTALDASRAKVRETLREIEESPELFREPYEHVLEEGFPTIFDEHCKALERKFEGEVEALTQAIKELEESLIKQGQYKALKAKLEQVTSEIHESTLKLSAFKHLTTIVKDCKKFVLTEGFPAVEQLATELLSLMTNGERESLKIDSSYSILVDDADIKLREVSAQAIANIALRLGLLAAFRKDSLKVFIGDEIDGYLHSDRFEQLKICLAKLVGLGYQVIVVSHKDYEDCNRIEL